MAEHSDEAKAAYPDASYLVANGNNSLRTGYDKGYSDGFADGRATRDWELADLRTELIDANRRIEAALALADKHEHGALRWADPLPVPEWIPLIRAALTTKETP